MGALIVGLILIVGAMAGTPAVLRATHAKRWYVVPVAALIGLLGAAMVWSACTVTVSTQNIGVVTAYGKPTGYLSNGFHVKWPWESVTEIDGRIQTDTYSGTGSGGVCNGITVRIAHQQTACMNVSIQWRIEKQAAPQLFRNYGTFDNIRNALVTRKLEVALNATFDNFDPIASLTSTYKEGSPQNPTASQLAQQVATALRAKIGGQIVVIDVLIPSLSYDASVQGRINSVLAQIAQTDIAVQAERTAAAQAAANKILAKSVSNDPGVIESRCEDITVEAMKAGYTLPPSWNCLGGSSVGVITKS